MLYIFTNLAPRRVPIRCRASMSFGLQPSRNIEAFRHSQLPYYFSRRCKFVDSQVEPRYRLASHSTSPAFVPCRCAHSMNSNMASHSLNGLCHMRCENQSEISTIRRASSPYQSSPTLPVHVQNPLLQARMPWRSGTSWVVRETWHTVFVAPFPDLVRVGFSVFQRTMLGEVARDIFRAVYAARFLMTGFAIVFFGVNYVSHLDFEGRDGELCSRVFNMQDRRMPSSLYMYFG